MTVRRCAVLGSPIAHSLSPRIHTRAYEVLGIADEWRYDRYEVDESALAPLVASCGPEWVGLSCTAPLKQVVLTLGEPSHRARLLGAGNTYLFNHGGTPRVENTDVTGFLGALARAGVTSARRAILLGNGATARSALYAVAELGVRDAVVLARSAQRAGDSLNALAGRLGVRLAFGPWGEVPDADAVDVLVSTVSAPLRPDVAAGLVRLTRASFDATYNHYPTELDRAARAAGIVQLSGVDLLVGQALDQITLMTGRVCAAEPLLAVAYAALDRALAHGGAGGNTGSPGSGPDREEEAMSHHDEMPTKGDGDDTSLDELNPEGVGGTLGADNTFEPEEDEDAPVESDS
ncbi:MAG: shikimate dehydrogenase family protein [Actinomycetes bacterium]